MPFNLTIGTERASVLQQSIENELLKRAYTPEADPVMAEYITIMVINNKTTAQITSELEDLIGPDFNPSFTEWLFEEAAKGASGAESISAPAPVPERPRESSALVESPQPTTESSRPPRNGIYQQAISKALPATSTTGQKRPASARSPSPNHPNKSRRTDLPTGPRAMHRDGQSSGPSHPNSRNLLDRIGGPPGRQGTRNFQRDEIQARIDNIVQNAPDPNMMMQNGFPPMGMEMMAANMANPLVLQEMMMNQMALMAQMASSMGIINPNTGQFAGPGYPMQPGGDMNMMQNNMQQPGFVPPQPSGATNGAQRGRGSGRGARGSGRGRGGGPGHPPSNSVQPDSTDNSTPAPVVAPTPVVASAGVPSSTALTTPIATQTPKYAVPERPQSPTLCKFALKCTNSQCRYSHPSPVATVESGVVLSNEACEKGKDCKDKDCIKAHVSPAVLNPQDQHSIPPAVVHTAPHHTPVPCRFGAACTRPGCTFNHPPRASQGHFGQPCRFGAACTRAQCSYQHPDGRVLPTTFHRGLSTTGGLVNIPNPEHGSIGGTSHNRSVTFNNSAKDKLEKQIKEVQDKKAEVEKAVKDAEAAASSKKDEVKAVPITA